MSSPAFHNQVEIAGLTARVVRVRGIVQGVGFRPAVWKVARQLGLTGSVLNDGEGVLITLQGTVSGLDEFDKELRVHCPPLASIENIETSDISVDPALQDFRIVSSRHAGNDTGVSSDAAICTNCRDEIRDPGNRRFGYAFTNCTHCGPRLSIINAIPYDRQNTSMAAFTMCPECLGEYNDPADRRFHAQPNACPKCGPALWLEDASGKIRANDVVSKAADLLKQGKILAIKGIGGFHLACDAGNEKAVLTLRERKHRPDKALALMAKNVVQIKHYCKLDPDERDALESVAAPIVLLEKSDPTSLPDSIAPGLRHFGFMLPYSPLHVLLMDALDDPLVMTSGNLSEEPQCIDNADAKKRLTGIADAFLMHDRDILNRIDDSVLRKMDGKMRVLRRARGFAPIPLKIPENFPIQNNILAFGAELKNTFCLVKTNHAVLSQHMGDLENAGTLHDCVHNLDLYKNLFDHRPDILAVDAHPEYLSTKLGLELATKNDLAIEEIQHHHAHIAACLADNDWPLTAGKVIGIALDGLGFGEDGGFWGGEILLADYSECRRLACLKPAPMPGGVQALRQPWRNTWAQLRGLDTWPAFASNNPQMPLVKMLKSKPLATIDAMIERGTNAPLSSSCGRLFDAVAGALGISVDQTSFEGQAAMMLEAQVDGDLIDEVPGYPFDIASDAPVMIEPAPMWRGLLNDLENNIPTHIIAARFHKGLAQVLSELAETLSKQARTNNVALSGGVFQNRVLFELVSKNLRAKNLHVLQHHTIPSNDGGIALGQAMITAARQQA